MAIRKRVLFIPAWLALVLAGQASAQTILPPGAIGWWPGEGNARDTAGLNHGTMESGAGFAPGKVGQAFSFTGQLTAGGINLGNVPAFDFTPSASFTMEAWINSVGTTSPNHQTIIQLNYNCGSPGTLQSLALDPQEKPRISLRDAGDVTSLAGAPEPLSKNTWHHIAGVREVTASGKTLKLYIDGVLAASAPDTTTGGLALNTPDFIGRGIICGPTTHPFKGLIDEPAVYSRALSAQEIAAIFQAGSAGKVTSIPPKLTSGAVTTFVEDQPAVPVDPALVIENDEPFIRSAFATITDIRDTGQESLAAITEGTSIAVTWAPPRLVLEGEDSIANYQKVLRSLVYRNASQAPDASAQRHVELVVRDAANESNRLTRAVNVVSVNDPPAAGDDRFALIGNTLLQVDMSQGDVSVRTTTPSGRGLLDNDADPAESDPLRLAGIVGCADTEAPFQCRTTGGSLVVLQASGAFAVTPDPHDSSASESFQYQVSDGTDTVTATVTLDRTGRVWYVKNDYTGLDPAGISTRPFRTLAEAQAASQPGDTIYVFEGDGTATGLSAGIELQAGQRLIGAGQDLVMPYGSGSLVVRAAVATPRIRNTGGAAVLAAAGLPAEIAGLILEGSADGVRMAAGGVSGSVRLHNVDIYANGGTGLRVTGGGGGPLDNGVAVAGASIIAQGGPAVDIEGTAIDIQLIRLQSLDSATTGLHLAEAFGPFSAGAGRIEGSAGHAVHLEGGDGELSFGGSISTRATGHSVLVENRGTGKVSFGGSITDNGRGIRLSNGGTASFSGGLTLRPAAGASGFVAEGGGTVSITGAANTVIAAGGGQALSIRSTGIGAAGLTFQSLSATGAGGGGGETGIFLENTGATGGLTVTGTGTAGSGGLLQGFGGAGVTLTGTAGISLAFLDIRNNGDDGIQGTRVTGLRLDGCRITGNGNAATDHGLDFDNLFGAVTIADTEVSSSGHHDVRIANTEGVLSALSVSGSRFVEPRGGYALVLEANGTAAVNGVSLTGSTFAGNPTGLRITSTGTGRISGLTTTGNTFTGGAILDFSEAQMATLTCSP